jgi:hypothetical protein
MAASPLSPAQISDMQHHVCLHHRPQRRMSTHFRQESYGPYETMSEAPAAGLWHSQCPAVGQQRPDPYRQRGVSEESKFIKRKGSTGGAQVLATLNNTWYQNSVKAFALEWITVGDIRVQGGIPTGCQARVLAVFPTWSA